MTKATVIIRCKADREKIKRWADAVPDLSRVTFAKPRRSLPQNDLLWSRLTDVSEQAEWNGKRYSPADWKDLFTASVLSAKGGLEIVPGLMGGFVILGLRTSDMDRAQMTELLDWIEAWSAQSGVMLSDLEKRSD